MLSLLDWHFSNLNEVFSDVLPSPQAFVDSLDFPGKTDFDKTPRAKVPNMDKTFQNL